MVARECRARESASQSVLGHAPTEQAHEGWAGEARPALPAAAGPTPLTVACKHDPDDRAHGDAAAAAVPDRVPGVGQPEEAAERVNHCGQAQHGMGAADGSAGTGRGAAVTADGPAPALPQPHACASSSPPGSPPGSTIRSSQVPLGHRIDSHTSLPVRGRGRAGASTVSAAQWGGHSRAGQHAGQRRVLQPSRAASADGGPRAAWAAGTLTRPGPSARLHSPPDTCREGCPRCTPCRMAAWPPDPAARAGRGPTSALHHCQACTPKGRAPSPVHVAPAPSRLLQRDAALVWAARAAGWRAWRTSRAASRPGRGRRGLRLLLQLLLAAHHAVLDVVEPLAACLGVWGGAARGDIRCRGHGARACCWPAGRGTLARSLAQLVLPPASMQPCSSTVRTKCNKF